MSALLELQWEFTVSAAKLILKADELAYKMTFGDAYRTPEQAAANAAQHIGIIHSLHTERLAIDLNFFKNGEYLSDGALLKELGEWWKALGPKYRWGGDFHSRPDGNHFSITPDGVRA